MLNKIISSKMRSGRRLAIPGFGTFVTGSDGRILFTELMRGDDGILRSAVAAERGVSAAEAEAIIDRFVADIRSALEHGTSYRIEGFGSLERDSRGIVVFRHSEAHHDFVPEQPEAETQPEAQPSETSEKAPEKPAVAAPEKEPEKPQPQREAGQRPQRRQQPKRKSGADFFIIVAIAIAAVALAVIAYGIWNSREMDEARPTVPSSEEVTQTAEQLDEKDEKATKQAAKPEPETEIRDLSIPSGK